MSEQRLVLRFWILVLFNCLVINLSAQKQNNNWYFGNRAAINFNSGTPVALTTSQMVSVEGCASVSDPATGRLLFYTNGLQVWDADNKVMPNGNGLLSGSSTSSTQGVLIVPFPGKSNQYYVFTVDETNNGGANGFRYSIVDVNLNNGLGDVVSSQKNMLIQTNATERMSVTINGNGNGYWIVIHERNNRAFKAYEVTASGLNSNPVTSNVGAIHSTVQQTYGDATQGCMKFNHEGSKIAVALYASNTIEIFDFDNCSGIVSAPSSASTLDNPYGLEFSPDNTKLYFSMYYNAGFNGAIYQIDLNSTVLAPVLVGLSSSLNNQCVGALELGPDNKIYISINSESWLSAIAKPNAKGNACEFVDKAIPLPVIGLSPTTGVLGLPQSVLNIETNSSSDLFSITSNSNCLGDTIFFAVTGNPKIISVKWDFGLIYENGDTSTEINPVFLFKEAGIYNVRAIVESKCRTDTVVKIITIRDCPDWDNNCFLGVPHAFTPNGDKINDDFFVVTTCSLEQYECLIFNRWGAVIYKSNDRLEKWDGRYLGNICTQGVYAYLITYKFTNKETRRESGNLTLLR